ncbi:hypothetical protein AB0C84_19355 [Actinomadura sp. NPDC048955]|uniref:hypothetical protein n=1 Tax=Actinomadura sp. NPDC048955 TaxID=3158228 RepID=UPI0033C21EE5
MSATPPPSVAEESPFFACLRRNGVRLPEDERPGGDEQRMLRGVENCASVLDVRRPVRIPVTKGDRFQACLAEHGVELPEPGRWLVLERGKTRTMDSALQQC